MQGRLDYEQELTRIRLKYKEQLLALESELKTKGITHFANKAFHMGADWHAEMTACVQAGVRRLERR